MKRSLYFILILIFLFILKTSAQNSASEIVKKPFAKTLYPGKPNHVELVDKSLSLAIEAGFNDTSDISLNDIKQRLETGVYSEDYDVIPGILGEDFPEPWKRGPDFNFNGLYPFTKIPYGSLIDSLSGWFRGLPHGYDPVQGFLWPGSDTTTVGWANSVHNYFSWEKAVELYKTGEKDKAYECLGHVLHLLEDLSIPAHVKLVNHGISLNKIKSGTIIDPDLLFLIVDEYELALAGGVSLPNVITMIPDLLDNFRNALDSAKTNNIPKLNDWKGYLIGLAKYTYNDSIVNLYYNQPIKNGDWGFIKNLQGNIVHPTQYGITPVAKIGDRWVQISIMSTASIEHGSFIPESAMVAMVNNLVPKAAEYGAGLIIYFKDQVKVTDAEENVYAQIHFELSQNYPNPFNPSTTFRFQIPVQNYVTLKVYDILGNEIATIVNEQLPTGSYKYQWNASCLASGVYIYRLQAGNYVNTKKLILMK